MTNMRHLLAGLTAITLGLSSFASWAQSYPERPIKLIAPVAPGSPTDITARLIAQYLSSTLGQPVIVDNQPAARGTVGASAVAGAEPDGYTLLFGNNTILTVAPFLTRVSYDPTRSFAPIASVSESPVVLVVNPMVSADSCPLLIALAKGSPGKLAYSSTGVGGIPYVTGELFKARASVDIRHIPFRNTVESITNVVAGQVELTFEGLSGLRSYIGAGRVRPLAITTARRNAELPSVSTMIECGYPGFISSTITALLAPALTPDPIVRRLNAAINAGLKSDQLRSALAQLASEPLGGAPQELAARIGADADRWSAVVKSANVKVE